MEADQTPEDVDSITATEEASIKLDEEAIESTARDARTKYEGVRGQYEDFASSVEAVLWQCLAAKKLVVHSITSRAKRSDSFEHKAKQVMPDNPLAPKYSDPFEQITDKAGVRVITYFLSTVDAVKDLINEQFYVIETITRTTSEPDRFGYQSLHFLVKYNAARLALPEYAKFADMVAEIQVRTILQHAWAEIEHDIQYKAAEVLPTPIRRRFAALAGLVEIADREFQAIQTDGIALREEAKKRVNLGQLDQVEITGDSLAAYLDRAYGQDRRMSDWSYNWTARLLIRMGFSTLAEVEECVKNYDDVEVSRALWGSKQGQLTRFEDVLLAGMADYFILAHSWAEQRYTWFVTRSTEKLERLKAAKIQIGSYKPPNYPQAVLQSSDLREFVARVRSMAAQANEAVPEANA